MAYLCKCSYCQRIGVKEVIEEHEKRCPHRKCEFKELKNTFLYHGYVTNQKCIHTENKCGICWGINSELCPLTNDIFLEEHT